MCCNATGSGVTIRSVRKERHRWRLTVNHRQPGFVKEPEAPVFEQPDGEDGEGEEQDEDEQVRAVLPVALLGPLLRNDVLHGTVLLG